MSHWGQPLTPAAERYLSFLEETWEFEAGAAVLETPDGPVEACGRVLVAREWRTLLPARPEVGTEEFCRRLAHVALGPLAEDYLVFLDSWGLEVDTPLRVLVSPGARRRFHLSLLQAEAQGRLEGLGDLEDVMSEALGQRVFTTMDGLYALDEVMSLVARPQPGLPTLPSAVRAVGLFLGASLQLPGGAQITGGRSPVFEYKVPAGRLRFRTGEVAREALLHPDKPELLAGSLRSVGEFARDPRSWPASPFCRWIEWVADPHPGRSEEGEQACRKSREDRRSYLESSPVSNRPTLSRVWRCETCREMHLDVQVPTELPPAHLEEARGRLREAVGASKDFSCRCGASLSFKEFRFARYSRFFSWPGKDVGLEVERSADGRLFEGWAVREPGGEDQPLPGEPTAEALREALGRDWSLATSWVRVMEAAAGSRQSELALAGDLTWLAVVPPGPIEATCRRVEELLGPLQGRSCRVIRLSETPADQPESFREWAGDFAVRLEAGLFGAVALVDWAGYAQQVLKILASEGLKPVPDPDHPGRIHLSARLSWGTLDVARDLVLGVQSGRYPEEVAVMAVREAHHALQELQRALTAVEALVPGGTVEVDPARHLVEVIPADGPPVELEADALAASGEGLERRARFLLNPEPDRLDLCRCGEPAHLTARICSLQYLETLPRGRVSRLARREKPGLPQILVHECPYHRVDLEKSDLERMGLRLDETEARLERDLDRTGGRFQALRLSETFGWAVALVGSEAASLAIHPGLVCGALEACGLEIPGRMELAALDQNLLLVCGPGVEPPVLAVLAERARALLEELVGRGGELPLRLRFARTPSRGRFQIEAVEEVVPPVPETPAPEPS